MGLLTYLTGGGN